MAKATVTVSPEKGKSNAALDEASLPRSVQLAQEGVHTADKMQTFLSALIGDVMSEAVKVPPANTSINACGKILKTEDLKQRYGTPKDENSKNKHLELMSEGAASS